MTEFVEKYKWAFQLAAGVALLGFVVYTFRSITSLSYQNEILHNELENNYKCLYDLQRTVTRLPIQQASTSSSTAPLAPVRVSQPATRIPQEKRRRVSSSSSSLISTPKVHFETPMKSFINNNYTENDDVRSFASESSFDLMEQDYPLIDDSKFLENESNMHMLYDFETQNENNFEQNFIENDVDLDDIDLDDVDLDDAHLDAEIESELESLDIIKTS